MQVEVAFFFGIFVAVVRWLYYHRDLHFWRTEAHTIYTHELIEEHDDAACGWTE